MNCKRVLCAAAVASLAFGVYAATPVFRHRFDSAKDDSGRYTGQTMSGAVLTKIGNEGIVDLGTAGGWFDFGTSLGNVIKNLKGDYAIVANLMIPSTTSLGANGNFIFNFGQSSSDGYAFLGANQSRYSISKTNWSGEQTVSPDMRFPQGEWVNVAVVQKGGKATVWINGVHKAQADIALHPSDLGATVQNWLGRSPYNGDVMLSDAKYADFRIYDTALTDAEIAELAADPVLAELNKDVYAQAIDELLKTRTFDFSQVRSDVNLPVQFGNGITGQWQSSNDKVITPKGDVTRPDVGKPDVDLELTLTLSKGSAAKSVKYPAHVLAQLNDTDAMEYDLDNIVLRTRKSGIRSDVKLPVASLEGSVITWKSANKDYITDAGKLLKLAEGEEGVPVTLTATATRNGRSLDREFEVVVAPRENYDSYLFTYFPSNEDENLYYAISRDGFNYTPLNGGKCVMSSDTVAIKKGIRDPHILRGADGRTFYMVATDMKSAEGWASNRGIVMYKSTDLVNWTHSTVHFPDRFPEWKNVTRVWAPEVIWDPDYANADGSKGRYMIYYSLLTNDGKCTYDKVYYSYANDDFTGLLTDPVYFYDRGSATIDCDIVWDETTQLFHMFFKNEGSGGICKVTAKSLLPEPGQPDGSQWSKPSPTLQCTGEAVEGAGVFPLINSDKWILMYDCYMNGHYQFCETEDLDNFTLRAETATSGAFTPRHGTVIPLTPEETERLLQKFPAANVTLKVESAGNINVRPDNFKMTGDKVYVPVRPGVDLKSFDPELVPSIGAKITPEGARDFTQGPLAYTLTDGNTTKDIQVEVAVEANPVLPGFTADPEVMYSNKTGRFYIYPTTDGFPGWGGYKFNVYSSADLVNWQKETCILDLKSDDVIWSDGNGWAPCIEEKIEDGKYRYYFYFSGNNPALNRKTLGMAVSDSPTGPFHDLGSPLIDTNVTSGQLIDSDVFTDPVSGDTFYYWGNGQLVASRLDPDMKTIKDATVITPQGGSLATYAFREGVYVFYRDGKYYFLWSVDDTGARNYHVAYGTSDSPMGPIKVAEDPIVLIQDGNHEIYGTGHNSVIQIPGRDEWYIVYHRINKKFVNKDPGTHREVCIDKLEFNPDGTIKRVVPTHRGISPVDLLGTEGIDTVMTDGAPEGPVSTSFYTLNGLRLSGEPTASGVYVRLDSDANGRRQGSKLMK